MKKKLETRIQDYRLAHHGDRALDDLLGDCEAELYKLRGDLKLAERRLDAAKSGPQTEAQTGTSGGTSEAP
jgi:hypothetical protein